VKRREMLLAALGAAAAGHASATADDTLERPARTSALASRRLITGLAAADGVVVAVGQRGHIVVSTDQGRSWTQASVPVSSDLTAVRLVNARVGYAVGHDGVVLGTRDGGRTWTRLLDGRALNTLVLEHMRRRVASTDATEQDRQLLTEALRNVEAGPDKPLLDLHFSNEQEGFIVGAYGLVLHTADGGGHWTPWLERVDNPQLLNLYAVCASQGRVYIAGEAGVLLRLDTQAGRFRALASPYKGSFFGLAAAPAGILAYGMRGNAFLSADQGETWKPVPTGLAASVVANAVGPDGTVVLADQGGALVLSRDGARTFAPAPVRSREPLAAVAFSSTRTLVLGASRGLSAIELTTSTKP